MRTHGYRLLIYRHCEYTFDGFSCSKRIWQSELFLTVDWFWYSKRSPRECIVINKKSTNLSQLFCARFVPSALKTFLCQ